MHTLNVRICNAERVKQMVRLFGFDIKMVNSIISLKSAILPHSLRSRTTARVVLCETLLRTDVHRIFRIVCTDRVVIISSIFSVSALSTKHQSSHRNLFCAPSSIFSHIRLFIPYYRSHRSTHHTQTHTDIQPTARHHTTNESRRTDNTEQNLFKYVNAY